MNKRVLTLLILVFTISVLVLCQDIFIIKRDDAVSKTDLPTETEITDEEITVTPEVTVLPTDTLKDTGKIIYLTFDDGPYIYTEQLLDILDEYNVKCTFFVTDKYEDYTYLIKEEYARGHAIGAHSYTHDLSSVYNDYLSDLDKIENVIENATGSKTELIRFPGGSSNTIADYKMPELIEEIEEMGYIYFDWDVDSNDATSAKNSSEVLENLKDGVNESKNYSLILCHDVYDYTVDAIKEFIPWALEKGCTFDKLNIDSPTAHHPLKEN